MTMKKQELINLLIALGFIGIGVKIFFLEGPGGYSHKQRMFIEYPPSPIREIFGSFCILLGIYFCFVIYRSRTNKKK